MFNVKINKSTPVVTEREPLASGAAKVYYVTFDFDDEWNDLVKTAIFKAGEKSVGVLLEEDHCAIPWDVLVKENIGESLWIGVYGSNNNGVKLPTVWDVLEVIQQGAELADAGQEPTQCIVDKIYEAAKNAENKALDALEKATEAEEKAAGAETHAAKAQLSAEAAESYAASAESNREKSAEYALLAAKTVEGMASKNNVPNAIKETLFGTSVAAVDVSPTEHDLDVKVRSKNLLKLSSAPVVGDCGVTYQTVENGGIVLSGTATKLSSFRLWELPELSPGTYVISDAGSGAVNVTVQKNGAGWISANGTKTRAFEKGDTITGVLFNVQEGVNYDGVTVCPQLERGSEATEYVPYVEVEGVEVKRYGKNLFNFDPETIKVDGNVYANCSLVEMTENGVIVEGNVYETSPGDHIFYNGWFRPYKKGSSENGVYLRNGDKVTISADYTWLDASNLSTSVKAFAIHLEQQSGELSNNTNGRFTKPADFDVNKKFRVSVTHTNTKGDGYFVPCFPLYSCKVKIENIQISFLTDTEYEEYNGQTAVSDADGNVTGLVSVSPSMTLIPEASGAVVECTYNRDLMKVIEELTNAIISLGGNI